MSKILDDCSWFANRHRGQHKTSGPHWSTIIRFVRLYDYACELEAALAEIADKSGVSRNADWARRRAADAIKIELDGGADRGKGYVKKGGRNE